MSLLFCVCSLEVEQLLQAKADLEKELERAREGEEERREREEALRYVTRVRAGERSQASLHSCHHCSPPRHLSLAASRVFRKATPPCSLSLVFCHSARE